MNIINSVIYRAYVTQQSASSFKWNNSTKVSRIVRPSNLLHNEHTQKGNNEKYQEKSSCSVHDCIQLFEGLVYANSTFYFEGK